MMENDTSNKTPSTHLKKSKKIVLGRGLGALIPGGESADYHGQKEFLMCDIAMVHPNRYQPRREFSPDELQDLSQSIREQGVIQPLVVRKNSTGYELIAGERRLRAARMAGLEKVPVVVRDVDEAGLLEMSLVENIQRQNLNPIEESEAYYRLMEEFGLTQEKVSERVGKSRSAIANFLRLKTLPGDVKSSLMDGRLSMGHAKVLLGAATADQLLMAWREILAKGLSVRDTERLVHQLKTEKQAPPKPEPTSEEIYFSSVAENLSKRFGTKVRIQKKGKKGKVEIEFYNDEDLDRLFKLLEGK